MNAKNKKTNSGFGFSRAHSKLGLFVKATGLGAVFNGKIVLDVGSSTGGFTKLALERGAKQVIAIEVGTDQIHPDVALSTKVELHEKTNILDVFTANKDAKAKLNSNQLIISQPNLVVVDVSFTSCRPILKHLQNNIISSKAQLILLFKPQFEADETQLVHGILKNSKMRRDVIKDFEHWLAKNKFIINKKMDSQQAGSKGNVERFYLLTTH